MVDIQSQRRNSNFFLRKFYDVFRYDNLDRQHAFTSRTATRAVKISPKWDFVKNVIVITALKR